MKELRHPYKKCFDFIGFAPSKIVNCAKYTMCSSPNNPNEEKPSCILYKDSGKYGNIFDYSCSKQQHYDCVSLALEFKYGISPDTPKDNTARTVAVKEIMQALFPNHYYDNALCSNTNRALKAQQEAYNRFNYHSHDDRYPKTLSKWLEHDECKSRTTGLQWLLEKQTPATALSSTHPIITMATTRGFLPSELESAQHDGHIILIDSVLVEKIQDEVVQNPALIKYIKATNLFDNYALEEGKIKIKYRFHLFVFLINSYLPYINKPYPVSARLRFTDKSSSNLSKELQLSNIVLNGKSITNPYYFFGLTPVEVESYYVNKTVFVTEGPLDCLSLKIIAAEYYRYKKDITLFSFVSIYGSSSYKETMLNSIRNCKTLILALDKDKAGDICAASMSNSAHKYGINVVFSLIITNSDGVIFKDANEALQYLRQNQLYECSSHIKISYKSSTELTSKAEIEI